MVERDRSASVHTDVDEAQMDLQMRQAFHELARPQISPYFDAQLRQRVAKERQRLLIRRCARVMAAYWLAVALISSGIVMLMDWSSFAASSMLRSALVLFVVTIAPSTWVLFRTFKTDFVDTILGTFEAPSSGWLR
jgi:hypothetical protein